MELILLVLAAVANLSLFLYLWYVYSVLPLVVPLHFTAFGETDRIAPKDDIFRLPAIGLLILLANLALSLVLGRRYRGGSLILLGAALAAQLIFWWAAANIVF